MRQFRVLSAGVLFLLLAILTTVLLGCGGGTAIGPLNVNLLPAAVSLNFGATAQITAQALGAENSAVTPPDLSYSSDNPAITVSPAGLICAGQWDANFVNCRVSSLPPVTITNPAHITATFSIGGLTRTSSAVVVTDHERIDLVQVSTVGNAANCVSQGAAPPANTAQFVAHAFSQDPNVCGGANPCSIPDETVGAVDWSVSPAQVGSILATSATTPAGTPVTVTAANPGQGAIVASIGPLGSPATGSAPYRTCAVASIHVQQQACTAGPQNQLTITSPVGGSVPLVACVADTNGILLTTPIALNWFSSQPGVANVSLGTVGTIAPGFAEITAACLPPTCNVNFVPPRQVFSDNVVTAQVTGTAASTVLVTTATAPTCAANAPCANGSALVPIDTLTSTLETALPLLGGVQVNSMVLAPAGTPVLMGTNCAATGITGPYGLPCSGLVRFDPTTATLSTPSPSLIGTVLATDGTRVVLANPPACSPPACPTTPVISTQVLIAPASGGSIEAALPIANATAAAFAIDGSQIYIVAGNQLFIYSPTLPLQTVTLGGAVKPLSAGLVPQDVDQEVALFSTGGMAYVADSAGDEVLSTCDDTIHGAVPLLSPPASHIAAIPNAGLAPFGTATPAMVDADSPYIDEVDVNASAAGACFPTFTNAVTQNTFANVPSFTAKQLIVTPDSKLAIILTSDQGVLVYDLGSKQTSVVSLSGGAHPIRGGVTPDGTTLFIGASETTGPGKVHRVDLTKTPPVDTQSIALNLCPSVGAGCNPDFLVVRPAVIPVILTAIVITPFNPIIKVGATQQFKATGTFSDLTTRDLTNFVTWSSSNPTVAVIGPTTSGTQIITTPGLAQGLATGFTTITATSGSISGITNLIVD
jgi:hypothetical protein